MPNEETPKDVAEAVAALDHYDTLPGSTAENAVKHVFSSSWKDKPEYHASYDFDAEAGTGELIEIASIPATEITTEKHMIRVTRIPIGKEGLSSRFAIIEGPPHTLDVPTTDIKIFNGRPEGRIAREDVQHEPKMERLFDPIKKVQHNIWKDWTGSETHLGDLHFDLTSEEPQRRWVRCRTPGPIENGEYTMNAITYQNGEVSVSATRVVHKTK